MGSIEPITASDIFRLFLVYLIYMERQDGRVCCGGRFFFQLIKINFSFSLSLVSKNQTAFFSLRLFCIINFPYMTDRIRRQFHVAAALRNRCSHSSLSSVESTNSSSQQLATETATATTDHNVNVSSTCLSCTRRNVTGGAFPRLRKVSNRLLTTFTRTIDSTRDNLSASLAKGRGDYSTCSVESCANNTAMASGNINCHDDDGTTTLLSSARDPRCFSQVYPTCHPARASLCLGKHPERLPTDCIPEALARGCALLKTTARGAHIREFRLDIAQQRITWDSRKKKKLAHSKYDMDPNLLRSM